LLAGSVLTKATFFPFSAKFKAIELDIVVLPTPPLPVKNKYFVNSTLSKFNLFKYLTASISTTASSISHLINRNNFIGFFLGNIFILIITHIITLIFYLILF